MVHFDTNFLVAATMAESPAHTAIRKWVESGERFGVSSIAWAEFLCGPLVSQAEQVTRRLIPAVEPFMAADAEMAARMFNLTGRRSRSMADCMIAAVAVRCSAKLATLNRGDFAVFVPHGLMLA